MLAHAVDPLIIGGASPCDLFLCCPSSIVLSSPPDPSIRPFIWRQLGGSALGMRFTSTHCFSCFYRSASLSIVRAQRVFQRVLLPLSERRGKLDTYLFVCLRKLNKKRNCWDRTRLSAAGLFSTQAAFVFFLVVCFKQNPFFLRFYTLTVCVALSVFFFVCDFQCITHYSKRPA
jgi:hypothetical protein